MTIITPKVDERIRTYTGRITPGENWGVFEDVAQFLGHLRLQDLNTKLTQPKTDFKERVQALQKAGVQDHYAKTIVNDNNSQIDLAWRNMRDNRSDWHRDVEYAQQHPNNAKARVRGLRAQECLDRSFVHGIRVVIGGRKLWLKAQKNPQTMIEFKKRRWWLSSVGDKNRVLGNRMIRVDTEGNISILVPQVLWAKYGLNRAKAFITIGRTEFKYGWHNILNIIKNGGYPIAYEFHYINGKWVLSAQTTLPPTPKTGDGERLLGVDTNAGHIDGTVLDKYGNPIAHITLNVVKRGMADTVNKLLGWASKYGVTAVAMEKLKKLQRNCTRKGGGRKNAAISQIKSGVLKQRLITACEDRGWDFTTVSPKNTSKNAPQWRDVCQKTNDTHQIASYLIGRRALGYSITRQRGMVIKDRVDSGQYNLNRTTIDGSAPALGQSISKPSSDTLARGR